MNTPMPARVTLVLTPIPVAIARRCANCPTLTVLACASCWRPRCSYCQEDNPRCGACRAQVQPTRWRPAQ
jgi:hypothetical protein